MKRINSEQGVMLIEAMVGMLIFAIGILAMVGLQGAAMRATTEAKFRSDASFMAGQIISSMWSAAATDLPNFDTSSSGASSNTVLTAWKSDVDRILPNATGANAPTISVTSSDGGFNIVVTVFWARPGDEVSASGMQQHKYTAITRIDFN
jgi:type IV pilus assembly protein PilV